MRFLFSPAAAALIPLVIWCVWMMWRASLRRRGKEVPPATSRSTIITIGSALFLLAAGLIYWGLSQERTGMVSYEPKRFEDGKLIDSELR